MFSVRNLPIFFTVMVLLGSVLISPAGAQVQALPPYTAGSTVFPGPSPVAVDFQSFPKPKVARTADRRNPYALALNASALNAAPQRGAPPLGTPFDLPAERTLLSNGGRAEYVGMGSLDPQTPRTAYRSHSSVPYHGSLDYTNCYRWQVLPEGLMYASYLAGNREPRFASLWASEKDLGWLWDVALGGRVGMIRYGTMDAINPQGWQLDIEGAAFPRLDLENSRDMVSADFRFGIPLTHRRGRWQSKFAYYHLSSHLGDEYMVRNNTLNRINYVRDCLVLGVGFFPNPDIRLYGEADWAFITDGGARPWEFQFGIDYSPAKPTGFWGVPFFALNGHLRQANNFGGNFTAQTGWLWRGRSSHLTRVGVQYFNGKSAQDQFFNHHEEQVAASIWYDY